jgi:putative ABC transport system substrate-binding protein
LRLSPILRRFAASLAQPEGNLTGSAGISVVLSGKHLELLKEALPGATRSAVLANPANPIIAPLWRETERAARAAGLQLYLLDS